MSQPRMDTQVHLPIEKFTLVEENESSQEDDTKQLVKVEDRNTI